MKRKIDFAQMIGSSTRSARELSTLWDNVNLADGTDEQAQDLARYFIRFHQELLDKPDMDGLIETSASQANLLALKLARDSTKKKKVLCSNLSHSSIGEACHTLGLEPIILDVNPNQRFQVDSEVLRKAISEHGQEIAAVVSTYGTTQLGHLENLAEDDRVKQLRSEGVWLHLDAAYGGVIGRLSHYVPRTPGFGNSVDRVKRILTLPDADSITIDPYKFIGKPGCSLLLVKDGNQQSTSVPYYSQSPLTKCTTLSAGPLAAWYQTMEDCGIQGLREIADDCVSVARSVALSLYQKGIHLMMIPELGIVPIALPSNREVERIHQELMEDNFSLGKILIKGKDYELNGLRIVVTPKIEPQYQLAPALRLCQKIGRLYLH